MLQCLFVQWNFYLSIMQVAEGFEASVRRVMFTNGEPRNQSPPLAILEEKKPKTRPLSFSFRFRLFRTHLSFNNSLIIRVHVFALFNTPPPENQTTL
ncbi:hypothetical protein L6452_12965 [Arctium lappa]|uniref:Uncharacterized protein n=1 Tax=Arctium lappa TaxID=4217 RepID=A0ACB9CGW7_ARCLA|nr:hypothetical protein L6452_12965 [Arctium lappa]